eukprot:Gb_33686 [translate_table: standard]
MPAKMWTRNLRGKTVEAQLRPSNMGQTAFKTKKKKVVKSCVIGKESHSDGRCGSAHPVYTGVRKQAQLRPSNMGQTAFKTKKKKVVKSCVIGKESHSDGRCGSAHPVYTGVRKRKWELVYEFGFMHIMNMPTFVEKENPSPPPHGHQCRIHAGAVVVARPTSMLLCLPLANSRTPRLKYHLIEVCVPRSKCEHLDRGDIPMEANDFAGYLDRGILSPPPNTSIKVTYPWRLTISSDTSIKATRHLHCMGHQRRIHAGAMVVARPTLMPMRLPLCLVHPRSNPTISNCHSSPGASRVEEERNSPPDAIGVEEERQSHLVLVHLESSLIHCVGVVAQR